MKDSDAQETFSFPALFPQAFEGASSIVSCLDNCGAYVVHHLYGRVRFARLNWPWEKGPGDSPTSIYSGLQVLSRRVEGSGLQPSLAIVAGSHKGYGSSPKYIVAVQELANPKGRFCLRLQRHERGAAKLVLRERVEPGSIAVVCRNDEIRALLTTDGLELVCLDAHVSPEELGIPAGWNSSTL